MRSCMYVSWERTQAYNMQTSRSDAKLTAIAYGSPHTSKVELNQDLFIPLIRETCFDHVFFFHVWKRLEECNLSLAQWDDILYTNCFKVECNIYVKRKTIYLHPTTFSELPVRTDHRVIIMVIWNPKAS